MNTKTPYIPLILLSLFLGCNGSKSLVPARIGESAPIFAFVDLRDGKTKSISELKGKVVVLDFWMKSCTACQEPMDKMQTYREVNPEWADSVVFMSVNIDKSQEIASKHITKQGWTKTTNVWLDPKEGKSPEMLAYAGEGIPAVFILSPDGTILDAGRGANFDVSAAVRKLTLHF
jgi:thiol-disulfide isomerase/thioredoxin